jgi:hypothetical protein
MEIQEAISFLEEKGYQIFPPESISVLDEEFETWWNTYNKKRGKDKCLRKWRSMPKKDRLACMNATPRYVASISDKQFQKDPFTYLHNKAWKDEIYSEFDSNERRTEFSYAKAANIFGAD